MIRNSVYAGKEVELSKNDTLFFYKKQLDALGV